MFSRRGFIRVGAASVSTLALRPFGLLPAIAAAGSTNYRALVCVFLFGGNDSNNSVIPLDDADYTAYQSARGALGLAASSLVQVNDATGAPYGFHALLTELASLFTSKQLAVVANLGPLVAPITRAQYQAQQGFIPNNLFSHADQQLEWQTSIAQGNSPTGWSGRAADYIAAQKINASSFPVFLSTAGNVLQGAGASTSPVTVAPGESLQLAGFNTSAASEARWNALNNLISTDSGVALVQAANNTLANSISDAKALTAALGKSTPLKTQFPKTALAAQLQQVAEIIQVQADLGMSRQIFFCSLGGFDTHTAEISTLNNLYPQVSQALAAFYDATEELGVADSVTTFTESDFNRTFQPTSGNGSDHAWGGHHFVLGGAVQGGRIFGHFPSFELGGPNDTDVRGRWIPTTATDQYGATLCSWFGIPSSGLASVFPNLANFPTANLGFLG
ncbi:MAG: DUF1501 domain-containing protein [Bryobacteraceae bacterium]|jgi:uncharacterized protein (DUF1501 family)